MTTIYNADDAQFEAELDAVLLNTNRDDAFAKLFAMPRTASDKLKLTEMCDLAISGPADPKVAADALYQRLVAHLKDDDVATTALAALHLFYHENRYDLAIEQSAIHAD